MRRNRPLRVGIKSVKNQRRSRQKVLGVVWPCWINPDLSVLLRTGVTTLRGPRPSPTKANVSGLLFQDECVQPGRGGRCSGPYVVRPQEGGVLPPQQLVNLTCCRASPQPSGGDCVGLWSSRHHDGGGCGVAITSTTSTTGHFCRVRSAAIHRDRGRASVRGGVVVVSANKPAAGTTINASDPVVVTAPMTAA